MLCYLVGNKKKKIEQVNNILQPFWKMSTFKQQRFVGKYPWKYNICFSKFFNTENIPERAD